MDFNSVTEFINNMNQNDKLLEKKKEYLSKLVKQIHKDEARLESQKIKAQKILEEILSLENKTENKSADKA